MRTAQRGLQEEEWPRMEPLERLWTPPFKDCLGQTGQGKALQSKHNSLGQEGGHQAVCGF